MGLSEEVDVTTLSSEIPFPVSQSEHRIHVGPADDYDLQSSGQFNLLTSLGLREHHYLLDIGCGSLRAGRLLMMYLAPSHYYGVEPEKWLLDQGIEKEVGRELITLKHPFFSYDSEFELSSFGQKFDFLLAQSVFPMQARDKSEGAWQKPEKL